MQQGEYIDFRRGAGRNYGLSHRSRSVVAFEPRHALGIVVVLLAPCLDLLSTVSGREMSIVHVPSVSDRFDDQTVPLAIPRQNHSIIAGA